MRTRRQVLKTGGAAIALAAVPPTAWAARSTEPAAAHLIRSAWTGRLGEEVGSGLRLDAVSDIGAAAERGLTGSEDAFVLSLSGPRTLSEGVHPLGDGELFVAPVGVPGERQSYEAVVDRSVRLPAPSPPPVAAVSEPDATGEGEGERRFAFLRSVRVRRGRPGLQISVRVAPGIRAVAVRVERDGTVVGRSRETVRGRRAQLGVRLRPRRARGRFDLIVTATDRDGVRTTVRRALVLR